MKDYLSGLISSSLARVARVLAFFSEDYGLRGFVLREKLMSQFRGKKCCISHRDGGPWERVGAI